MELRTHFDFWLSDDLNKKYVPFISYRSRSRFLSKQTGLNEEAFNECFEHLKKIMRFKDLPPRIDFASKES